MHPAYAITDPSAVFSPALVFFPELIVRRWQQFFRQQRVQPQSCLM